MAPQEHHSIKHENNNTYQDVTPIRVRGKKHARKRTSSESERNVRTRVAKTLLKSDEARGSRNARDRLMPQYGRQTDSKPLSRLELLPSEILEHVLLHCLSVSLARASPYIAWKLSHKATYNAFCTALFGYFWQTPLFGTRQQPRSDTPSKRREEMDFYVSALESALVTRWMTWTFLCEFKQTFFSRYQSEVLDTPPMDLIFNAYDLKHQRTRISFHLPAKLLRQPITGDRFTFLATLVKAGGRINWIGTTLGETAQAIWRQAVKDSCYSIVSLMMRLGVGVDSHENPVHYVVSTNTDIDINMVILVWTHSVLLSRTVTEYLDRSVALDPVVLAALPQRHSQRDWSSLSHKNVAFTSASSYIGEPYPTDEEWRKWQDRLRLWHQREYI